MLYLSRLILNPRSRQVQSELRDPYQMHRTLSRAFGDNGAFEKARVLFRIDEKRDTYELQTLVQSKVEPQWDAIAAKDHYLLCQPEMKPFTPHLPIGGRYAFRLRANPTVKRDGKRFGLYQEDEQLAWLKRKGTDNGFEILAATTRPRDIIRSRTTNDFNAELVGVVFEGLIGIVDSQKVASAIASGIGSGKAFGFGLLSVAKP